MPRGVTQVSWNGWRLAALRARSISSTWRIDSAGTEVRAERPASFAPVLVGLDNRVVCVGHACVRPRAPTRPLHSDASLRRGPERRQRVGWRGGRRHSAQRACGGKKLRYVARAWPGGVNTLEPRSTICPDMNLPLYSPTAPGAGAKPGYGR